jgi:AAA15 family ATPase/GTPase
MGDGLTRLFHIALAMVNAEGGYLLIDEFENGLYWEVQEQLWPVVFEMAELLNVQVFATSHSQDCIKGFERAWEKRPELGAMYRLERMGSSVTAFRLPMEGLSDALDSLVEVR